jgi:hypothetical protein
MSSIYPPTSNLRMRNTGNPPLLHRAGSLGRNF